MKILSNYPMSDICSFKCGGKAQWFIEVEDINQFCNLLSLHKNKKLFILGNGTNTLCSDNGFGGLVICTKNLNNIKLDGNLVECECGVDMFQLNNFLAENNLGGLEWSYGIPGTVGGAVKMNAGAFDNNFGNFIEKIEIFDVFSQKIIKKEDILFNYRTCNIKNPILKIWIKLAKSKKSDILKMQQEYFLRRQKNQPTEPSAGSIFKRKENLIPAKIIEELNLKGTQIGGAEISTKHCGFIVNKNNATATDVLQLINLINEKVYKSTGKFLEKEIVVLE